MAPDMPYDAFDHISTWVFDLDNTLYPSSANLFAQIERLMTAYITDSLKVSEQEAVHLRDYYWRHHGTTLAGLMAEHGMDPDPFLHAVHEIDLTGLLHDTRLRTALEKLPGRKIVYTNGSRRHADRVVEARGLSGVFQHHYGVEDAGYRPKPHRDAFEKVFAIDGFKQDAAAMFEDEARNLEIPHAMGMRTVLVGAIDDLPYIHHTTDDLTEFLCELTT